MIVITRDVYDEYRVPAPDGQEAGAYYTDDKQDAIDTLQAMHGQGARYRIKRVTEHREGV